MYSKFQVKRGSVDGPDVRAVFFVTICARPTYS